MENFYFDRRYILFKRIYHCTLNTDKETIQVKCQGEYHIRCISGSISYIMIGANHKESFLKFDENDDYQIKLIDTYYNGITITHRPPHRKTGDSFNFQVDINPPLNSGDEVRFRYEFTLPRFIISNREALLTYCRNATLEPREHEYLNAIIQHPVSKFIHECHFTSDCKIKPRAIEADLFGSFNEVETSFLRRNIHAYSAVQDNDSNWILRIERDNPRVRTRYKTSWLLPAKNEL
jgi:hypothetical protein